MTLDGSLPVAGLLVALAAALPILALVALALHLRARRALRREADMRLALTASQSELTALRAALEQVPFGVVLLDQERRAQFINCAFRRTWSVPDDVAEGRPSFMNLMYYVRDAQSHVVPAHRLGPYVAEQMALISSGDERPLDLRLADGEVLRFRCTALPDGGHVLSYGSVGDLIRHADMLAELASIDGLTGLYNRRHFLALAESEWSRFKRYGRPLSLLMLDIDKFKSINDRHGHDVGDRVIKEVADLLRNDARTSDVAARVGGEEFALLLPEATLESACAAAERFRRSVAERVIAVSGGSLAVTISIGASIARQDTAGIPGLMKEADLALYRAKRTGRNRVCTFDPAMAGDGKAPGEAAA